MTGRVHPKGWIVARLGELGDWRGGGTPSKENPAFWTDGITPWVSPKDMKVSIVSDATDRITEMAIEQSAAKLIPAGSVLFVTRSGILARTFPVARTTVPVTINQDLRALTPAASIDPDYVAWGARAFASEILRKCSKSGTTVASVETDRLLAFELPLAPLSEQHRIAEAIESYLTRLDDAVATLERVQRNLERYRASVLKTAVEGRLVPIEAELARAEGRDHEPASVLLERILAERRRRWEEAELAKVKAKGKVPKNDRWKAKYKEPSAPATADLPELPEGWCWAIVEQLESGARRSAYGVLVPGPDLPDGVLFVRVGDIVDGRVETKDMKRISREIADKFGRTYLIGGEVLLTLVGTIGRTAVVSPGLAGANVARAVGVLPIADFVNPHWVEIWFRSPVTRQRMIGQAHEVARKTLNLGDVRLAPVALPPRLEQDRALDTIETLLSTIDAARLVAMASAKRCDSLRQSILKWAFEGRLVDQDLADEPAAKLLDRIKAERGSSRTTKSNARGRQKTRRATP